MEASFCINALEMALKRGTPWIFNTDQGSQFTSETFTGTLKNSGIAISMDGRGRCMDNIFTERLWRTVKYENVYLMHYKTFPDGMKGINPDYAARKFFEDARRRARRRTLVLQVPDNKANSVKL